MMISNSKTVWMQVLGAMALGLAANTVGAQQISVDLGGATLSGAGTYSYTKAGTNQQGQYTGQITSVATTGLGAASGVFDYSFDPAINDRYLGGYSANGNIIAGSLFPIRGLTLAPAAGVSLAPESAAYKISGVARLSDAAEVKFTVADGSSVTLYAKGVRSQVDDLPFELYVKESAAQSTGLLLSWYGRNPYSQGPGGVAATFSTAEIIINKVEYTISSVPEPTSWALMLYGAVLAGGVARRRRMR
jgi:hypothetical protein